MIHPIHSVWAPFTEAEREIVLLVFRSYLATRHARLESAIAEDILWRLVDELEEFEKLDDEHYRKQATEAEATGATEGA